MTLNYHEFLAELRELILERGIHADALDQLFAELVNDAGSQALSSRFPVQKWSSLRARHDGLMRSLKRWHQELDDLRRSFGADQVSGNPQAADVTLIDQQSDNSVADVDLEALEADLIAEPLPADLLPVEHDADTPDFVWPSGSTAIDPDLSALDALAADLDVRTDPWSSLDIRDYRQTGSPAPLKAENPRVTEGTRPPSVLHGPTPKKTVHSALREPSEADASKPLPKVSPEAHSFETLATVQGLASLAIKLILRTGESMHTGFSTGIGTEHLAIALEQRLQPGQLVHAFFELPTGAQVGVNGVVTDVAPPEGDAPPYSALIRYLDLTEDGAEILREVVATY